MGLTGQADRRALLAEAEELRQVMFEIANTRDAQGQSLFAGFRSNDSAFTMSADGRQLCWDHAFPHCKFRKYTLPPA